MLLRRLNCVVVFYIMMIWHLDQKLAIDPPLPQGGMQLV